MIVQDHPCHEWSILFLAPIDFFDFSYHDFPLTKDSFQGSIGERSMEEAIICLLEATVERLCHNWTQFKWHFDVLLDKGDEGMALFRPDVHDDLLQDDENLRRTKKYAWAIACLTELEKSISSNIREWKRFKSARLDHLLQAGTLSVSSRNSVEDIDQLCVRLEGLHRDFSLKLTSTKARRDAVSLLI
jgi:hypothetical protein